VLRLVDFFEIQVSSELLHLSFVILACAAWLGHCPCPHAAEPALALHVAGGVSLPALAELSASVEIRDPSCVDLFGKTEK
jgi:hypothetical protein